MCSKPFLSSLWGLVTFPKMTHMLAQLLFRLILFFYFEMYLFMITVAQKVLCFDIVN